jgi:hypothetical protein
MPRETHRQPMKNPAEVRGVWREERECVDQRRRRAAASVPSASRPAVEGEGTMKGV